MRHVLAARAVAAGALGMGEAPTAAGLVACAGGALATTPGAQSAVTGAVDLATVALAADQRLTAALHADEQSRRAASALLAAANLLWSTPRLPGYWSRMRAQHGVGHGVERNRQVQIGTVLAPRSGNTSIG
jgi:hypothetical protein